jgi:hypothetical protein
MTGYTIKNLKDVDDSAVSSSDLEARFARKHLDSRELGVSYFCYAPSGGVRREAAKRPDAYVECPARREDCGATTRSSVVNPSPCRRRARRATLLRSRLCRVSSGQ